VPGAAISARMASGLAILARAQVVEVGIAAVEQRVDAAGFDVADDFLVSPRG